MTSHQESYISLEKQFKKFSLTPWEPKIKEIHKNLIVEGEQSQEVGQLVRRSSEGAIITREEKQVKQRKRTRVTDTTHFPESTHVFLEMTFRNKITIGSGQMIGPYHVLTCAHNVYDMDEDDGWAIEIFASPGANGKGNIPFGRIAAVKAIIPEDWTRDLETREQADIALIFLERNKDHEPGYETGWASFAYWQDDEFNDIRVWVSGYPGDKENGTLYEQSGKIVKKSTSILCYEVNTTEGQSGSPIWKKGGFPIVLGVHCRRGYDGDNYNEGIRISEKYFYWITSCMEMNHVAAKCKEEYQGLTKCRIETPNYEKEGRLLHFYDNGAKIKYTGQYKLQKIMKYDTQVAVREGYGLLIKASGERYKGHFLDAKRHGLGVCIYSDGSKYEGKWENDGKEGNGIFKWPDGSSYDGEFHEDERDGHGRYKDSDGGVYMGPWKNGKKDGYGIFTYRNQDNYRGTFYQNERHGQGIFSSIEEGWVYEGQWRHDRKEGKGKLTWTDGDIEVYSYEGEFYDDLKHGQGTEKFKDGSVYIGQWKNGEKEGPGKFIEFQGVYSEELFLDGKSYDQNDPPFSGNKVFTGQGKHYKEEKIGLKLSKNDQPCQRQDEPPKDKPMKKPLKKSRSFKADAEALAQINFFINNIAGDNDVCDPSKVRSARNKDL